MKKVNERVYGFWVIGSVLIFAGSFLAGKIDFIEGSTLFSVGISILISLILILSGGAFWISSALNVE